MRNNNLIKHIQDDDVNSGHYIGTIDINMQYNIMTIYDLMDIFYNTDDMHKQYVIELFNALDGFDIRYFRAMLYLRYGDDAINMIGAFDQPIIGPSLINYATEISKGVVFKEQVPKAIPAADPNVRRIVDIDEFDAYFFLDDKISDLDVLFRDIKLAISMPVIARKKISFNGDEHVMYKTHSHSLNDNILTNFYNDNTYNATIKNMWRDILIKHLNVGNYNNLNFDGIYSVILDTELIVYYYITSSFVFIKMRRNKGFMNPTPITLDKIMHIFNAHIDVKIQRHFVSNVAIRALLMDLFIEPVILYNMVANLDTTLYNSDMNTFKWMNPNNINSADLKYVQDNYYVSLIISSHFTNGYTMWRHIYKLLPGDVYVKFKTSRIANAVRIFNAMDIVTNLIASFMHDKITPYMHTINTMSVVTNDVATTTEYYSTLLDKFIFDKIFDIVYSEKRDMIGRYVITTWNTYHGLNDSSGKVYVRPQDVALFNANGVPIDVNVNGKHYMRPMGGKSVTLNLSSSVDKLTSPIRDMIQYIRNIVGSRVNIDFAQFNKYPTGIIDVIVHVANKLNPSGSYNGQPYTNNDIRQALTSINYGTYAQELFMYSDDEIRNYILNSDIIEHKYVVRGLEELFNIDIFIFDTKTEVQSFYSIFNARRYYRPLCLIFDDGDEYIVYKHGTRVLYSEPNIITLMNAYSNHTYGQPSSDFIPVNIVSVSTMHGIMNVSNAYSVFINNIQMPLYAQYIDANGKVTAIGIKIDNNDLIICVSPCAPVNLPLITDLHMIKYATIQQYENVLTPIAINTEDDYIIGIWVLSGVELYLPISKLSVNDPLAGSLIKLPNKHCYDTVHKPHEIQYVDDMDTTKVIYNCILWLFTLWYFENNFHQYEEVFTLSNKLTDPINGFVKLTPEINRLQFINIVDEFMINHIDTSLTDNEYNINKEYISIGYDATLQDAKLQVYKLVPNLINVQNGRIMILSTKYKDVRFQLWHYLSSCKPGLRWISKTADRTMLYSTKDVRYFSNTQDITVWFDNLNNIIHVNDRIFPENAKFGTPPFDIIINVNGVDKTVTVVNAKSLKHALSIAYYYRLDGKINMLYENSDYATFSYIEYTTNTRTYVVAKNTEKIKPGGLFENDPLLIVRYTNNRRKSYGALLPISQV